MQLIGKTKGTKGPVKMICFFQELEGILGSSKVWIQLELKRFGQLEKLLLWLEHHLFVEDSEYQLSKYISIAFNLNCCYFYLVSSSFKAIYELFFNFHKPSSQIRFFSVCLHISFKARIKCHFWPWDCSDHVLRNA